MSDTAMVAFFTALTAIATAIVGSVTQIVLASRAEKRTAIKIQETNVKCDENKVQVEAYHKEVNSQVTKLVTATEVGAEARGHLSGREAEKAERNIIDKARAEGALKGHADEKALAPANVQVNGSSPKGETVTAAVKDTTAAVEKTTEAVERNIKEPT